MEIHDLSNIPVSKYPSVGGKARGLHALCTAGLNIARGFVVTDIENEDDIERVADFYIESGLDLVAVRSSATGEDGIDFSNAGQYSSFLNIAGRDQLKTAVIGCLNSLNNETAASYASYFRKADSSKMSVIIQQMIHAEKAGVCFTYDPMTGSKNMLIEAVPGLGEQLVSGSIAGRRYLIPAEGSYSEVAPDKAGYSADARDGLLSEVELEKISKQAGTIGRYLDMPLDTEWAIDKEGQLFWLQARPITTLNEPGIDELDVSLDIHDHVITNCNVSEMLPGAVTPLSLSTSVYAIDYGMRKMFVSVGVYKNLDDIPPTSCILSVCNHLFINLTSIYKMADCVLGASRDAIDLSICGRVLEGIKKSGKKKVNILIRINNGRKYFKFLFSKDRAYKEIKKLAENFTLKQENDPEKLYAEIDKNLDILNHAFWLHYITSGHSGSMTSALYMILNANLTDNKEIRSIIASALENINDIESVDILHSLRKLARLILAENPSIVKLQGNEILNYIKMNDGDIRKSYDSFISRHGHRAIREAEIRSKGWSRDEINLMDYLRPVLVSGGEELQKCNNSGHNTADLLNKYKGFKKVLLKYMVRQARASVRNREFSKSMCIKVLDQFKIAYANLATQLVQLGILPDEDLIYFLQHKEISQVIHKGNHTLIKKALARRRLLPEQQMLKFHEVYTGKPEPAEVNIQKLESGTILNGSPCSRGFAEGKARVVKSI
ncbi:hypothetical protein LLG07_07620 [bacterium]|nr:hypothetical protein [bacterium]